MIDHKILEALQKATTAAIAASTMPGLAVQYYGLTLDPTPEKYLQIVFIPNNINGEFWSSGKTYRGLFRLLLHWPIEHKASYEPMAILASICAYFPIGAVFQSDGVQVKIYQEPDLTGAIQAAPEQLFPVTIRYESFQI